MITKEQAIDILDKFDFFQGQRAGRELWAEKPFDVQEKDISDFAREVAMLKEYISEDVAPKSEVARCKDCVYFQPNFVLTNNGERRPYTEEEMNSKLGMVTCDVGINCGSRCERFDYWEDNRFPVWFQENDYCSYFRKKYTEGESNGSKQ